MVSKSIAITAKIVDVKKIEHKRRPHSSTLEHLKKRKANNRAADNSIIKYLNGILYLQQVASPEVESQVRIGIFRDQEIGLWQLGQEEGGDITERP